MQMRICARLWHDVAMLCLARSFLQWKDDINFIAQDLIEQLRPNRPPSLQIFNPKCPVTPNFKRSAEEILFAERRGVEILLAKQDYVNASRDVSDHSWYNSWGSAAQFYLA